MGIKCLGSAGLARWCVRAAQVAALFAPLALSACAHVPAEEPPCLEPEALRVALSATARLNPDDNGAALATVVRLYQLKALDKLQLASFDDLLGHDHDTLGDDLAVVQEITINPGERLSQPLPRKLDATYLVAVALFRRPTSVTWRAFRRLSQPDPQYCHAKDPGAASARATIAFVLDENRIEVR
jgi:type VI secretion system protein VasD